MKYEFSTFLVFINLVLLLLVFLFLRRSIASPGSVSKYKILLSELLIIVFGIFPFYSGDFYHLGENILLYQQGWQVNLETGYEYILRYVHDYILFRAIVWGISLLIVFYTIKRLKVPFDYSLLIFSSFFLPAYSYARVSCAMSLMFLGVTYLVKPILGKKYLSFFLAIGLLYISTLFHKSSYFAIVAIILGIIFINKDRKQTIVILLASLPFLVLIVQYWLGQFMNLNSGDVGLVDVGRGQQYLDREEKVRGIGELIGRYLHMSIFYYTVFLYYRIINNKNYSLSKSYCMTFGRIAFLIVFGASIFAFDLKYYTAFFHYRLLNFAMIPIVLFLGFLRKEKILMNHVNNICIIGIISGLYTVIYALYCSYVNIKI